MMFTGPLKKQAPVSEGKDLFGISRANGGRYHLEGELSFASVELALKKTAEIFVSADRLVFDLGGIAKVDSAGLALLLEWLRQARAIGVELHYTNLPRQLMAMAHVAGVDEILIID